MRIGRSGLVQRGIPRARAGAAGLVLLAMAVSTSCRKTETAAKPARESNGAVSQPQIVATSGGIEMVLLPAGRFAMGSDRGEADEAPRHEVSVDAFLMDRREVTQAAWAGLASQSEFLAGDPSHFKGADLPVEMVRWDMAALYCNLRSRAEGLKPCYNEDSGECDFAADGYRLPTEAEWEYACRAGSEGDFDFAPDARDLKSYAWFAGNSGKKTCPAGRKKPNAWGLFDMHGNVAEWCNDRYGDTYYRTSPAANPRGPAEGKRFVLRGGAWNSTADACRSTRRAGEDPGFADACFSRDAIGFRCVRRAPDPAASERTVHYRPDRRTGFVYSDVYLSHKTGESHPERPERLTAIVDRLKTAGLLERLQTIAPRKAEMSFVAAVHDARYVERVRQHCAAGPGWLDSRDTPVANESYDVAISAAGGVLAAVDAVMAGRIRNAFCAVRPPGHHALPDRAMGFCLLNNVAIAARYVQAKHQAPKVLIVDWDVHHGNGTQAIFYRDPTVFYFSVHQAPFYPGTGSEAQRGEGDGLGYTLNAPLPAGSGDEDYRRVFREVLEPAARRFDPDFVLVSAGFDAHEDDPLGGMRLTAGQYAEMTRIVKRIAEEHCEGRLVSVLEGGYSLRGLADSVEAHVGALLE
ncbi:MAG: SUMF1/EgtB/PvdO family nonheme iron enzyme [Pirellulales bacterium]|nr:SUMF1/EgtB/PvdO family nonheme iron enzyme [Pirellulales bacterium]